MTATIILAPTAPLARALVEGLGPCRNCGQIPKGGPISGLSVDDGGTAGGLGPCGDLHDFASGRPDVTVEAEFGSVVVKGARATWAHHVPSAAHNPSPCADPRVDGSCPRGGVILLSHIDLDSIGGAIRASDKFHPVLRGPGETFPAGSAGVPAFWRLAGAVDVRGPHRLAECAAAVGASAADVAALRAVWAWARTRPRFPSDVVSDVSAEVAAWARAIDVARGGVARRARSEADRMGWAHQQGEASASDVDDAVAHETACVAERDAMLAAGAAFAAAEDSLEMDSFMGAHEVPGATVAVRRAAAFTAHLHRVGSRPVEGTANLDTRTGAITIALASPVPGVSCAAVMRVLFGPEAGGHAGIAGTPRGVRFDEDDLMRSAEALSAAIQNPDHHIAAATEDWV